MSSPGIAATSAEQDNNNGEKREAKGQQQVKGSAFLICFLRCIFSFLPPEAGALRYDERTPNFEGVALQFNPSPKGGFGGRDVTLETTRQKGRDFPALLRQASARHNWNGLEFNLCRAHFVDQLLLESVSSSSSSSTDHGSPIRQIVVCGVGQDYRAMRYGKEIAEHGAKVLELDLTPMMELRGTIKKKIVEANPGLVLPETHCLSIDFDTQRVSEVLLSCPAFDPALPTLYLWEGVSYYLSPESMRAFLLDIRGLMNRAPPAERQHHRLFFDHLIDLPKMAAAGDGPGKAMLDTFANSEPLRSFLDFDRVEPYLSSVGFDIHQQLRPPDMYRPYQVAANEDFRLKESKYFGMVVAKPKINETR